MLFRSAAGTPGAVAASLVGNPRLAPAIDRIAAYGPRLFLLRGSPADTVVAQLDALVRDYRAANPDGRLVLFLDYLQKVPVLPEPPGEAEKVTRIVNGLKDIALGNGVPLVSIVAADKEGLKASRLRHHHLRGSSALEYEADVILILNEKYSIVSRTAIEFNPHQAQRFHDQVIVTIEKNRAGQHRIDLELEKRFAYSCFAPDARPVAEKLIEERLYNE